MVSPFNGEGISYAMESARFAAEFLIDAAARSASGGWTVSDADAHLSRYADYVRAQWGSHFTLGRAFAALIGKPAVMKLALRTGMPHSCADAVCGPAAGQPHRSCGQGLRGQGHPASWKPWCRPRPTRPSGADGSPHSGANSAVSATKVRVNP